MFVITLWQLWDNLYKHGVFNRGKSRYFFLWKKSPRPSDQSGPVSKCDARQTAAQIGALLCQNFKVQICKKITIEKTPGSKKPKIHFLFFQQSLLTIPKEVETIWKKSLQWWWTKKKTQIRFQTEKSWHMAPRMSTTNARTRRRIFLTSPFLFETKLNVKQDFGALMEDPIPSDWY